MPPTIERHTTNRRGFLAGGAALMGAVLVGCSGDDDAIGGEGEGDGERGDDPTGDGAATSTTAEGAGDGSSPLTAADFAALGTCLLTPEQMEGPFYLAGDMVRRDITDGLPGHPLRLGVRVVDAACEPIPGAVVDIWHADVDGDYSGYIDGTAGDDAGEGTTFLRGPRHPQRHRRHRRRCRGRGQPAHHVSRRPGDAGPGRAGRRSGRHVGGALSGGRPWGGTHRTGRPSRTLRPRAAGGCSGRARS